MKNQCMCFLLLTFICLSSGITISIENITTTEPSGDEVITTTEPNNNPDYFKPDIYPSHEWPHEVPHEFYPRFNIPDTTCYGTCFNEAHEKFWAEVGDWWNTHVFGTETFDIETNTSIGFNTVTGCEELQESIDKFQMKSNRLMCCEEFVLTLTRMGWFSEAHACYNTTHPFESTCQTRDMTNEEPVDPCMYWPTTPSTPEPGPDTACQTECYNEALNEFWLALSDRWNTGIDEVLQRGGDLDLQFNETSCGDGPMLEIIEKFQFRARNLLCCVEFVEQLRHMDWLRESSPCHAAVSPFELSCMDVWGDAQLDPCLHPQCQTCDHIRPPEPPPYAIGYEETQNIGLWPHVRCEISERFQIERRNCLVAVPWKHQDGWCCFPRNFYRSDICPHNYVPECNGDMAPENITIESIYGDQCNHAGFHRCVDNLPLDCMHREQIYDCAAVNHCCSRMDYPPYNKPRIRDPDQISVPGLTDCMGSKPHTCTNGDTKKYSRTWDDCQNEYHATLNGMDDEVWVFHGDQQCKNIKKTRQHFKTCSQRNGVCSKYTNYISNWKLISDHCTDKRDWPGGKCTDAVL